MSLRAFSSVLLDPRSWPPSTRNCASSVVPIPIRTCGRRTGRPATAFGSFRTMPSLSSYRISFRRGFFLLVQSSLVLGDQVLARRLNVSSNNGFLTRPRRSATLRAAGTTHGFRSCARRHGQFTGPLIRGLSARRCLCSSGGGPASARRASVGAFRPSRSRGADGGVIAIRSLRTLSQYWAAWRRRRRRQPGVPGTGCPGTAILRLVSRRRGQHHPPSLHRPRDEHDVRHEEDRAVPPSTYSPRPPVIDEQRRQHYQRHADLD